MKNKSTLLLDITVACFTAIFIVSGLFLFFYSDKKTYKIPDEKITLQTSPTLILTKIPNESPATGQINTGIQTKQVTIKTDVYTIVNGDTLWDIAEKAYGDPYMWTRIATANHMDNPDLIYPGTKISIPRR
jgi:nucleoid-associated protein YgaU